MCGRYVMGLSLEEFKEQFAGYQVADDLPVPSWNIKPTNDIVILREDHKRPGVKLAEAARWSLVPVWSKELKLKYPTFNARAESVLEKPSFKASAKSRRCLIPAQGYYEWTGDKGAKTPHYIHLADELILFAGLYSWWHEPGTADDEGWHLTTTMLTMESYGLMQEIHHRIPVFMSDDMQEDWLSPEVVGEAALFEAVTETSRLVGEHLVEHTVVPLRGDGPELITAAE